MADRSPPIPSSSIVVVFLCCWVLWLLYALLVLQAVLLGLLPGLLAAAGYVAWRLLVAVESIADSLRRLADERQQGDGGATDTDSGGQQPGQRSENVFRASHGESSKWSRRWCSTSTAR
jgi:hypothetical protein